MSQRRSALGRGLGALISNSPSAAPNSVATPGRVDSTGADPTRSAAEATSAGVLEIEVARIDPNPEQPRREFDPAALQQLADSIRQHGVLQPVVVRQAGGRYELVMGERRFRASQLAGRRTVPAVILDVDPADRLELAIVENVQRQDLNPIELALAYQALARAGHTQDEIGRKVSMDRSSIANHIRLLDLSREIQTDVESGRLSMGHAKALLQVADPQQRQSLRGRILGETLSVRATEEAARALVRGENNTIEPKAKSGGGGGKKAGTSGGRQALDPDTRAYLERIERRLQTRVELVPQPDGAGRLEIHYFNLEDLERIGGLLLGQA
ncbi:MAG: ParB/RepB/Spo0J family partition protein [Myxococcota bacterium]